MTYSKLGTDSAGNTIDVFVKDRREGMYIIGATGKGKTVLLQNLILQDIAQGVGICVLDPLGGLVRGVLERIPDNKLPDVINLSLTDVEHPFGLNLYQCSNPSDALIVQYALDRVMHIWDKLFGIDKETPLLADYMANCAATIIANQGYSMAEIPMLLQEKWFRDKLLANVKDNTVRGFWRNFEAMTNKDRNDEVRVVMRRLREFMQPMVRNIVGQSRSTINMSQIMNEGKILLISLDPELETVSNLIGSMFVARVLMGAFSRRSLDPAKRRQFHFYVDEADRFSTSDFKQVYDMARQFGIGTTLAHQTRIHMLEDIPELARSVLQAATTVVFMCTPPDSTELSGKFDATPPVPPMEEVGKRKKQEPVTDVVGHLLRVGHKNPLVNTFKETVLQQLTIPNPDDEKEVYEYRNAWNNTLYRGMIKKPIRADNLTMCIADSLSLRG